MVPVLARVIERTKNFSIICRLYTNLEKIRKYFIAKKIHKLLNIILFRIKIYIIFIELCTKYDNLLALKGNNPYKMHNVKIKSDMCK